MIRVKGTDARGNVVTLEKSRPKQLSLFSTFLPQRDKYSNTIELYDAIPKYFASTQQLAALRITGTDKKADKIVGHYLKRLKRSFKHRGEDYSVTITPARLEDANGIEWDYYPTEREELVEEALKKLACDRLNGVYLDSFAGVQFTLYELQKELKSRGHSIHLSNLIQALNVCNGATIEVVKAESEAVLKSTILPTLLLTNRKQWLDNPRQARCYAQFNPLVTCCIDHLTYRQFDYSTFMEHKRQLSRWLHKRLSHNYVQADYFNPYHIKATTIIRDSGLVNAKRMNDRVRQIDAAMKELRAREIILGNSTGDKDVDQGRHNRIKDVKYTLYPHPTFVDETKKANKRKEILLEKARQERVDI